MEYGEDCDGGAGCDPDTCLRSGTEACIDFSGDDCCGNGLTDTGEDSGCDLGGGQKAEWCDGRCLNRGSSYRYDQPSFCGDRIVGPGEDVGCESVSLGQPGPFDPFQVILGGRPSASAFIPATGLASETVGASIIGTNGHDLLGKDLGRSTVSLVCRCRQEADPQAFCESIDAGLGCDDGGCCAPAPQVVSVVPASDAQNVCRNAAVKINFDTDIDPASVNGGSVKVLYWISNSPNEVEGRLEMEGARTAVFYPKKALEPNRTHRIVVNAPGSQGGQFVRSASGVPIKSMFGSNFRTSASVCQIAYIYVAPSAVLIQGTEGENSSHELTVHTQAAGQPEGTEISSTDAYRFVWRWFEPALSSAVDLDVPAADSNKATVRARLGEGFPKDGNDTVTVRAEIYGDTPAVVDYRESSARVTVMLCDNPWPSWRSCQAGSTYQVMNGLYYQCGTEGKVWLPFIDVNTGVAFHYCRDGATAGDGGELLPALNEDADPIGNERPEILHEYILTFPEGEETWSRDAIGLRVSKNSEHYGVSDWYYRQGFTGSPQSIRTDGYEALREGRSVYVNAAAKPSLYLPSLFTNVYTVSHSDGATPETTAIFSQITNNLSLNWLTVTDHRYCLAGNGDQALVNSRPVGCRTDRDCRVTTDSSGKESFPASRVAWRCDAEKGKIVRDVRRWADLQSLRLILGQVAVTAGFPTLESGTYLRSLTTSAWPSWKDTLTPALGNAVLPTDPAQGYMAVGSGYDQATGWNAATNAYYCPSGSETYAYQGLGGKNYILEADMEYGLGSGVWSGQTCLEMNQAACQANSQCRWVGGKDGSQYGSGGYIRIHGVAGFETTCSEGKTIGVGGLCGDGAVNGGSEDCEPGLDSAAARQTCTVGNRTGLRYRTCRDNCTWGEYGQCQTGTCGDGVIQSPEQCDDGSLNGQYGRCAGDCSGLGFRCGDGLRQPNEVCDCRIVPNGATNGTYALNALLALSGQACLTGGASAPSCAWDCSGVGPRLRRRGRERFGNLRRPVRVVPEALPREERRQSGL